MALSIPAISVLGVVIADDAEGARPQAPRRAGHGPGAKRARLLDGAATSRRAPNWWILGGSLVFVVFTVTMGLGEIPYNQEIIFAGSFAIVAFLVARLTRELDPVSRETLIGTAIVIFVFRAMPTPGPA